LEHELSAWQVQEAKQRFSEVLRKAAAEGDQIVTRHGVEVAAVIDFAEYRRLRAMDARARHGTGLFPTLHDPDYAAELTRVVAARGEGSTERELGFEV
jgi:prevent-host-death family protein